MNPFDIMTNFFWDAIRENAKKQITCPYQAIFNIFGTSSKNLQSC